MGKLKEEYGELDLDEYGIESQETGKSDFNKSSRKLNTSK